MAEVPKNRTLGDVLYENPGKPLASEEEWTALVRAIAARDESALHALYDRAHRPVFTFILRMTANRQTAEELTLDVFHDVWRRASQYDPENGTVLGWIMNQAHSRAIDHLRFMQRKKRVAPAAGNAEHLQTVAPDPLDDLAFKEQSAVLRNALTSLTPDERQAVEAAFFGELTYVQVAERLHAPIGTIKTRIRSGLQKLRRMLGGASKP